MIRRIPPSPGQLDRGSQEALSFIAEQYMAEVIYTAYEIAQREGYGEIKIRHIYMAKEVIANKAKPSRVRKMAKTLGDVVLGVSLSIIAVQLFTMTSTSAEAITQLAVWIVIGFI